jgi:hypothetical protein
MGLFGPLGAGIGDIRQGIFDSAPYVPMYGTDPDAMDYAMRLGVPRPLPTPNRLLYPQSAAAAGAGATSPGINAAAPVPYTVASLPAMQTIGGFTTRRTELFGPLATVAI